MGETVNIAYGSGYCDRCNKDKRVILFTSLSPTIGFCETCLPIVIAKVIHVTGMEVIVSKTPTIITVEEGES